MHHGNTVISTGLFKQRYPSRNLYSVESVCCPDRTVSFNFRPFVDPPESQRSGVRYGQRTDQSSFSSWRAPGQQAPSRKR